MQTARCLECLLELLTHFLAKTIFSRGYGGVHNTHKNSGGSGVGLLLCSKIGNSGEEGLGGGSLQEISSMVGLWIFSGTAQYAIF